MVLSKKQLIIFLIIFLFVFAGLLFFYFIKQETKIITMPTEQELKKYIPPKRGSLGAKVVNENDCEKLENLTEKEICYNKLKSNKAAITENLKDCLKINDYNLRNRCIFDKVMSKNDEQECHRIADHHLVESCLGDIGIVQRDLSYCNKFSEEPHEYQECIDRISAFIIGDKGDINKCTELQTLEYSGLCVQNVIGNNQKINCDKIKDDYFKCRCISSLIYPTACSKEECDKLPDNDYKKVCLARLNYPGKFGYEIDSDQDGLYDEKELWLNIDPFNPDTDGDGLSDYNEVINIHSNPVEKDTDGDGLFDYSEVKQGTSIQKPDTDGDGILDGADDDPLNKFNDTDGDRLSNEDEKKWGTDPNKKDTDGDGVNDWEEIRNGINALGKGWQYDTDDDGLIDVDEIFYRTNRLEPDTDGDGINDGDEIRNLTNPLGKGDMDFDKDGLSDKDEKKYGTNPSKKDTNDDGVDDLEAIQNGLEAVNNDTDGDGLNNRYELNKLMTSPLKADTDGDGLKDLEEISQYFTDPNNPDTDGDGYSDGDEVKKGYNPNGKGKL